MLLTGLAEGTTSRIDWDRIDCATAITQRALDFSLEGMNKKELR
jgi:hypothetical protein